MGLAAVVDDRCTRCSRTDERRELLRDGVVEAARQVMLWHLLDERLAIRAGRRMDPCLEYVEAIQMLRDCLAGERAARGEV